MKQIKAYIKPHKLSEVTLALHQVKGLTGMSVTDVRGFGHTRSVDTHHRTIDDLEDYAPHVKIEIVCKDELVEKIVSTVEKAAHTGLHGDGKIYVSDIRNAVRISTGERGEQAV
jgi:nitrogen regulatory protein P-II 1